jgi:hypothetical protein
MPKLLHMSKAAKKQKPESPAPAPVLTMPDAEEQTSALALTGKWVALGDAALGDAALGNSAQPQRKKA